jgi:hypothetical protein
VPTPWRRARVAPLYVERAFSVKLDGVLGVDTLSSFDIDIDLPSHRLALYQKQTCAGAAPAWTGPYAKILARQSPGDHLCVPAQLDGHSVAARRRSSHGRRATARPCRGGRQQASGAQAEFGVTVTHRFAAAPCRQKNAAKKRPR